MGGPGSPCDDRRERKSPHMPRPSSRSTRQAPRALVTTLEALVTTHEALVTTLVTDGKDRCGLEAECEQTCGSAAELYLSCLCLFPRGLAQRAVAQRYLKMRRPSRERCGERFTSRGRWNTTKGSRGGAHGNEPPGHRCQSAAARQPGRACQRWAHRPQQSNLPHQRSIRKSPQ